MRIASTAPPPTTTTFGPPWAAPITIGALKVAAATTRGRIALLQIEIEGAEIYIQETMLAQDLFTHIGMKVLEVHGFRFPETEPRIRKRCPPARVNFGRCLPWPRLL